MRFVDRIHHIPYIKVKKRKGKADSIARTFWDGCVHPVARKLAYYFVWKAQEHDGLYMRENIHPFGASVRAEERRGVRRSARSPNLRRRHRRTTQYFPSAFAYPLVYTFSISNRGSAPQRSHPVRARNCATSCFPYRRYVVANLRALAI